MLIRCWGARGSIPVSGREYLVYGGDTTCIEIRTKQDEIIIIDAGSGIRRLGNQLLREQRHQYSLLMTHAHWDHLLGFLFFRPVYLPSTELHFYGCPFAQDSIREMMANTMKPPYFPVNFDDLKATFRYHPVCNQEITQPFELGSLVVTPTLLSHPNQGLGYKFAEDGKTFVLLTDNELGFQHPGGLQVPDYTAFVAGADFLIHDAEFTPEEYPHRRTWGHSTWEEAVNLALAAGVRRLGLFHHNQDRTDDQVDAIVAACRQLVRARGGQLDCFAVATGTEVTVA